MPVTHTLHANPLKNFDAQTQFRTTNDGKQVVDHGASIRENVKEIGQNLVNAVDPTNHFRETARHNRSSTAWNLGAAVTVMMIPWNVAREVLDIPFGIAQASKNVADIAVHATLAATKAVTRQP